VSDSPKNQAICSALVLLPSPKHCATKVRSHWCPVALCRRSRRNWWMALPSTAKGRVRVVRAKGRATRWAKRTGTVAIVHAPDQRLGHHVVRLAHIVPTPEGLRFAERLCV
jgi:hypothetical protein